MGNVHNSLPWHFLLCLLLKGKYSSSVRLSHKDLQMANSKTRLCCKLSLEQLYARNVESTNFINPQAIHSAIAVLIYYSLSPLGL